MVNDVNKRAIIKIYKITNMENNKCYVGQTKGTIEARFCRHANSKSYIGRAIRKYGKDSFKIEELCTCLSRDEANKMEEYFIGKYNCYGSLGYNLTRTGRGTFDQNTAMYVHEINQEFDYSNFTTTEQGYLFDIIRKVDRFGRIKYGKNSMQYCRKWQDLSRVLNSKYDTLRKNLIPKLKKYNIIKLENNTLYINPNIITVKNMEDKKYVILDHNENMIKVLDLDANLIYKLKFE